MVRFNVFYEELLRYKNQYGNCLVPQNYRTENGIRLGGIVKTIRRGGRKLTKAEKERLNELGFVWHAGHTRYSFDKIIKFLEEYKLEYGDCLVPGKYCRPDGISLGSIVNNIRTGKRKTTIEEKERLNELGFVWEAKNYFSIDEIIKLIEEYKLEYGNCVVPSTYCTKDGIKLGAITTSIRVGHRKISNEERAKLNKIGFICEKRRDYNLNKTLNLLEEYKAKYGDCLVPATYVAPDGTNLGRIVNHIRTGERMVTDEEKSKLDALGFVWRVRTIYSFDEIIKLLEEYKLEHGNCLVPNRYFTKDGIKLGQIVVSIRQGNRKVTVEEKARLDALGFVWRVYR